MSKFFTFILFIFCFSNVISSNESDLKTERKLQFVDESYELLMVNIHGELLKKQNECSSIDQCSAERLNKLSELFSYDRVLKQFVPIYKRQAEYPKEAIKRSKEGHTIVSFDINEDGTTSNHKIIEGKCTNRVADLVDCSLFNRTTLKAARFLKYKPVKRGGKGITITDVPHKFSFVLELSLIHI